MSTGLATLFAMRAFVESQIRASEEPADPAEPSNTTSVEAVSVEEFARRMSLTEKSVRSMIRDGMPIDRPRPRTTRINLAAARAWMARRTAELTTPTLDAKIDAARRRAVLDASH